MRSNQSQPQPVVGMARRAIRGGVPDTLRSRWHCVQPTRQASLGGRPCFSSSRESRTRPARCPWSLSPCIAQMHGLESRGVLRREDSQQAEAGFTLFLPWRRLKVLAVHELVWTCKGRRSHARHLSLSLSLSLLAWQCEALACSQNFNTMGYSQFSHLDELPPKLR